jgi:CheY-like chemotaxis protein
MEKTRTKRILVVEQNEFHRFFYSYVLSFYYSCPVLTTDCGKKALKIIEENSFDLIYVDIANSTSNGIETLKQLRYNFPDYKVPIIAITADRDRDTLSQLISLGITEYIVKPEDEENIFDKLGVCFN